MNLIIQLTKFLDCFVLPLFHSEKKDHLLMTFNWIHHSFLQALIFSFGACLNENDRIVFDRTIRYLSGLSSEELPNDKYLLFDHLYQSDRHQWTHWNDLLPAYQHDRSKRFTELLVPTIDTIRLGTQREG